jgi:hypothetical protein
MVMGRLGSFWEWGLDTAVNFHRFLALELAFVLFLGHALSRFIFLPRFCISMARSMAT